MRVLFKFQQPRPPVPWRAKKMAAHLFEKTSNDLMCPSCEKPLPINHGERVVCDCGLHAELYGNAVTIWRD